MSKDKYVTFSVDCTFTLPIRVDENASNEKIAEMAWDRLNQMTIDIGDLENADWELLQIDE